MARIAFSWAMGRGLGGEQPAPGDQAMRPSRPRTRLRPCGRRRPQPDSGGDRDGGWSLTWNQARMLSEAVLIKACS
jgi:hypothetical protein